MFRYLALPLITLTLASPLGAQSRNCATHAAVVERPAAGYGETRQSIGMGADNTVV